MSAETSSKDIEFDTTADRKEAILRLGMPRAAINRFLKSRGIRTPDSGEHYYERVVELLDDSQIISLIKQHKYAGRQTVNYFVIKGISEYDLGDIKEKVGQRLPRQDDVDEIPRKPFLADAEEFEHRLYLAVGYFENAGSEDPVTGKKEEKVITKRIVVVIHDERDLIEIRGSDTRMVEDIRDELCESIGKYKQSVKKRPNLGPEFQNKFNERVERYFNIKVKVDDKDDETLDTISFTSKEDESGERHDARESRRVERELSAEGSEITMGYVETDQGFRFRINRDKAKLSFMKAEREENLEMVTKVIDEVLREAGEYSQGQISGIDDVPE